MKRTIHIISALYKLSEGEAGVDYMQLLDVLVPVNKLFQIMILLRVAFTLVRNPARIEFSLNSFKLI